MTDQNNSPRSQRATGDGSRPGAASARAAAPMPRDGRVRPDPSDASSACAIPAGGCPSIRGSCSIAAIRWCAGVTIGIVASIAVLAVISCAMWWRLASGPISLDIATPWLTAAIEQNFGSRYRIQVGGTQLERDDNGRTALRLRDIVVRDAGGAVVASAPKAEVGIAGSSLLMGNPARRELPSGRRQSRRSTSKRTAAPTSSPAASVRLLTLAPVGAEQPRTQGAAVAVLAAGDRAAQSRGQRRGRCWPGSTASAVSGATASRST